MKGFFKIFFAFILCTPTITNARAVVSRAARATNTPTSGYTYNYMYPYLNNQMRQTLNPGNANAQSTSPINVVVKTTHLPDDNSTRRVIARSGRAATTPRQNSASTQTGIIRNMPNMPAIPTNLNSNRRVSPRGSIARATRTDPNTANTGTINYSTSNSNYVSANRCMADYTECMNSYCMRDDTEYNRCFCSSKLSQIESTYQPQIDSLIKQILRAKQTGDWTDAEMAEYWNDMIGQYVGENTWTKLDDALNIDWPSATDRMDGQNAYLTGHQYCVQHLRNCAYAVPNMRDVYRSEIARDCAAYEKSLDKLKTALETALNTYNN
ncbi:MAG: hypothetical protein IJS34_01160 [Alphaproteobacteria bacterium]|nr:hypothetical protein [Alphaproteobacteria bacterium]